MKQETLDHIKLNHETLDVWFRLKIWVDPSHDTLKPIVVEFKEAFPTTNINGCQDCVNDMIGWALVEYKKTIKKENNDTKGRKDIQGKD